MTLKAARGSVMLWVAISVSSRAPDDVQEEEPRPCHSHRQVITVSLGIYGEGRGDIASSHITFAGEGRVKKGDYSSSATPGCTLVK